jgi:hypothetical protein
MRNVKHQTSDRILQYFPENKQRGIKPQNFSQMSSLIRNSYTVSQKLKAIELSRSIGVCAASRQLSISKSSISRWVSQKSEYLSVKSSKLHRRKLCSDKTPMFPSEESYLYDQIISVANV